MKLRAVTEKDHLFISILFQTAFDGRYQHQVLEQLRADDALALELVAEDENTGQIIGHISFASLKAPEGWWALMPIAIIRDRQQSGIETEILRYGLDRARQSKAKAIVTNAADHLSRFGFSVKAAENLFLPNSTARLMLFPIAPGTAGQMADLALPAALVTTRVTVG